MHRIDTLTAVKDKFGPGKNGFTDGNLRTGRLATWLNSAMWNAIQEEICGVIEKAGIELNKEEHDQLYKAILLLVGGAINEEALLIKNNLSDVEDRDEAVENLGLKPTVDKAKNAVQRDGDTMTGELKIRGVNALRIFNEAFGLIFRRSEECLHLIPTSEGQGKMAILVPCARSPLICGRVKYPCRIKCLLAVVRRSMVRWVSAFRTPWGEFNCSW